jgi:isopenicillin N synthase-like dioxygenase
MHAANDASAGNFDDKVRYGAHTDYQGFTILRPDKTDWHILEMPVGNAKGSKIRVQCGGLEVYHRSQQRWLQVRIPRELNALVVNAGKLL